MKKLGVLIFGLFVFTGCTSLGDKFVPKTNLDSNKARVYVYRVSRFVGSAFSPYMIMDGEKVADLANGGYSVLEVSPGKHNFAVLPVMSSEIVGNLLAHLEKGKEYYLRYDVSMFNGVSENIEMGQQAGLAGAGIQGGGGAVGGAAGAAASGFFLSSSDESQAMLKNLDRRAQAQSLNPGFLFVKSEIGKLEITETRFRKFSPPQKTVKK